MNYREYIENHIIDIDCSHRGGTLKVDCSELFPYIEEPIIGAYQNYLGGGMLGAVVGASQFYPEDLYKKDLKRYEAIKEECKRFLHEQTNHVGDKWEESTYFQNQLRPVNGY